MATRIEKIISRVRDKLADPGEDRWSNEHLIRLIDEGQQDIAKHTKILKGEKSLAMLAGQANYVLPEDAWLLTRAAYNGCKIEFYSHSRLDEMVRAGAIDRSANFYYERSHIDSADIYSCWDLESGPEIQAIIYDRRNLHELQVYPRPTESSTVVGSVVDIEDYEFDSIYGVVTSVSGDTCDEFQNSSNSTLHLWYVRMPTTLVDIDSTLEIPPMFDTALQHYVTSMAFDDDYDTLHQEKAQKASALYARELEIAQETQESDGIRNGATHTVAYRGAF